MNFLMDMLSTAEYFNLIFGIDQDEKGIFRQTGGKKALRPLRAG